jgi:HTH-type transcriptional regulator / antitoxin HipB
MYASSMTPFTPHRLGQIIKAYRLEQKLTQAQLATKSGTGLRFIVELERGKPTVQLGKVIAVADALGLMLMLQKDASLVAAFKSKSTLTATLSTGPSGISDRSMAERMTRYATGLSPEIHRLINQLEVPILPPDIQEMLKQNEDILQNLQNNPDYKDMLKQIEDIRQNLQNDPDYKAIQLLKESRLSEIQSAFKINPAKPEVEPK